MYKFTFLAVCLLALTVCNVSADTLVFTNFYVKASNGPSTEAFLQLQNNSDRPLTLLKAISPSATRCALRETLHENGIARVMEVPDFVIAPGETLTLKPGGQHICLQDLPAPIQVGQEILLTLTFDNGQDIPLEKPLHLPVRSATCPRCIA